MSDSSDESSNESDTTSEMEIEVQPNIRHRYVVATVVAAFMVTNHVLKYVVKEKKTTSILSRHMWYMELMLGNDNRFFEQLRMRKQVFRQLKTLVRSASHQCVCGSSSPTLSAFVFRGSPSISFTPLVRLLLCSLLLLFLTNRALHIPLNPLKRNCLNREVVRIRRATHQGQGQISEQVRVCLLSGTSNNVEDHANINLIEATDLLRELYKLW
ncbi:hypothetical protein P8452_17274 [Trifolium repens]|nr:hypothetical protein P8452_17274 [Trifolium repens]